MNEVNKVGNKLIEHEQKLMRYIEQWKTESEESDIETYQNEYGETWYFKFNNIYKIGILNGSDICGVTYFVIEGLPIAVSDGIPHSIILTKKEREWLNSVWNKCKNNY